MGWLLSDNEQKSKPRIKSMLSFFLSFCFNAIVTCYTQINYAVLFIVVFV